MPPPATSLPPTLCCAQTSEEKSLAIRTDAEMAAWPGLARSASTGRYRFNIHCLNAGTAQSLVLLSRTWLPHEEASAKRVAAVCWEARRALLAARPDAGEAEQRAAVEDALLEASATGALDAWRLLQRDGGEAPPADSVAELSAAQLHAACTLLAVGRNTWIGLPTFVKRAAEAGGLVVSRAALQALGAELRGVRAYSDGGGSGGGVGAWD